MTSIGRKLGALVLFGALASPLVTAEILEQVIVKVNGEIITKTELEARQVAVLRQRLRQNVTPVDLRTDAELRKLLDEITPQLLVEAIDEMLVLQRGRELGYRMTDDQFRSILQNIRKENKLEDDAAFEAALRQEGLTLEELRKSLERQMIFSRVQQVEVFSRIAVSEEEARRYYADHAREFTTPSTLTIREILIEVPAATAPAGKGGTPQPAFNVALDDEARARAEALRQRVLAGEDFAELAARESASPSKANGGLIGPINEDELAPALRELFAGMSPGQVSEPVRTQRGYQIFKLESKTASETMTFEQAREQIANRVFQQKRQGEFERYLRKLRAQAIIEWKHPQLKALYERQIGVSSPPAASSGD